MGNHKGKGLAETRHMTARIDVRLIEILERRAAENDRSLSAELRQILRDAFRGEREVDAAK